MFSRQHIQNAVAAVLARAASLSHPGGDGTNGVTYTMEIDGSTTTFIDITPTDAGNWLLSGAAADYDVRATLNSGDTPGGSAVDTWLNLGTERTWNLITNATSPAFAELTAELLIEIRPAGGGATLSSAIVSLYTSSGSPP